MDTLSFQFLCDIGNRWPDTNVNECTHTHTFTYWKQLNWCFDFCFLTHMKWMKTISQYIPTYYPKIEPIVMKLQTWDIIWIDIVAFIPKNLLIFTRIIKEHYLHSYRHSILSSGIRSKPWLPLLYSYIMFMLTHRNIGSTTPLSIAPFQWNVCGVWCVVCNVYYEFSIETISSVFKHCIIIIIILFGFSSSTSWPLISSCSMCTIKRNHFICHYWKLKAINIGCEEQWNTVAFIYYLLGIDPSIHLYVRRLLPIILF